MKYVALFFLINLLSGGISTISRVNRYTQEAAIAYQNKYYIEAIAAYEYLLQDLQVEDDQIRLNLAHAYYRSGQAEKAQQVYRTLINHPYPHIRAVVLLQLGNITASQKKYKKALSYFKDVLVTQPSNNSARYNYELLKKYLEAHPELAEEEEEQFPEDAPTPQDRQAQPDPADTQQELQPKKRPDRNGTGQEEMDSQEQEEAPQGNNQQPGKAPQPNGKGQNPNPQEASQEKEQKTGTEKGEEKGLNQNADFDQQNQQRNTSVENMSEQDARAQTQRSRLQRMNITPEKAQILLDAMRNAELQYIQQLPRKSTAKPDPSKPDW